MIDLGVFSYAFLIGFLPVLLWLGFWLFQDGRRPEPRLLLLRAFFAGMLCVPIVIPLQQMVSTSLPIGFLTILVWAGIEEVVKFSVARFAVLGNRAVDEPIDIPVYLITVALGFAALENTLFLLSPLSGGHFEHGLITGNLRFIGATLIHVLSSATIGIALALVFFKGWRKKILYGLSGLILAILLHTIFNFTIIQSGVDWLLTVFAAVWVGIMFILLMLEKVKLLRRPPWWQKIVIRK
jgi:RsiW-degrading membrane proteinase PrsW (M82 family)